MSREHKVIAISNHDDPAFKEWEVVGPWLTESQADRIAEILNEDCSNLDSTWFISAHKDRVLRRGMEDLV